MMDSWTFEQLFGLCVFVFFVGLFIAGGEA